jgi:REP element-mobilizing transposase RayT
MPFRFYAHLSWTTWARLPLIDETVANFLGPFLLAEAKRHGARVMEMGIVRDHVHLLLELPPQYDAGYDFRSVGIRQLPGVTAYVRDQELKHGPPKPSRPMSPAGLA